MDTNIHMELNFKGHFLMSILHFIITTVDIHIDQFYIIIFDSCGYISTNIFT